jgi:two-component system response regulator HydG
MQNRPRILIIDDEEVALRNLERILKKLDYEIFTASTGPKGLKMIREDYFDAVLTDLRMEKVDGQKILEDCRRIHPETEVIMITGYATVDSAISAIKKGAYHYISKPYQIDEVRNTVKEAVEKVRLKRENLKLKEDLKKMREAGMGKIITKDPAMLKLLATARQIAPTDCNVFITGTSGTGKELLARYVHECSKRAKEKWTAINCGVFSEALLTSELFGHEKGAFTGADRTKQGIIEITDGGTLFLDEITEMSVNMQVKLLRVIQDRVLMRVGGTTNFPVNVRLIAASNRNVLQAVSDGEFRDDLYYRLNVVSFHLPPLEQRKGDIPLLANFFRDKHATLMGKEPPEISAEVISVLKGYVFPGNVRELENIMERAVALANNGSIEPRHLPDDIQDLEFTTFRAENGRMPTLENQEVNYIKRILDETGGNKTQAAEILGIGRVSLWRKIKRYELE